MGVVAKEEEQRARAQGGRHWSAPTGSRFAVTRCVVTPLP